VRLREPAANGAFAGTDPSDDSDDGNELAIRHASGLQNECGESLGDSTIHCERGLLLVRFHRTESM